MKRYTSFKYYNFLASITFFNEFPFQLDLKSNDYLKNVLNLWRFEQNELRNFFREPLKKNEWVLFSSPTAVNAFYHPYENNISKIVIPPVGFVWLVHFPTCPNSLPITIVQLAVRAMNPVRKCTVW